MKKERKRKERKKRERSRRKELFSYRALCCLAKLGFSCMLDSWLYSLEHVNEAHPWTGDEDPVAWFANEIPPFAGCSISIAKRRFKYHAAHHYPSIFLTFADLCTPPSKQRRCACMHRGGGVESRKEREGGRECEEEREKEWKKA